MKNTATKEAKTPEENKELTSYQKLLKDLDDRAFAYEFKLKKFERAKDIIGDFLAVTTGQSVVTVKNDEWGHGHLLELFEILSIRHKNFYIPDFLEDLSGHLFSWTFTSDEVSSKWKAETLRKRGLDQYGVELNKTADAPEDETEETDTESVNDDIHTHHNKIWANKLAHVFESADVDQNIKKVLSNVLNTAANEANIGVDEPEIIKESFPLIMGQLDPGYRRGVMFAIQDIIESGSPESVINELHQYEKHFVTGKTASEMEAER